MEDIKTKLETLTKEREDLATKLQELDSAYKLNIRNLDRIDGAIYILKETLGEKTKDIESTEIVEQESKH